MLLVQKFMSTTSGLLLSSADMAILPLKSELMVLRLLWSMSLRLQYGTMNIINQKNMRENVGYFYTMNQFYKIPQDGV